MAAWLRSWRLDLGLRASGLLSCGIAYAAIARLVAMQVPSGSASAAAYGLATIGFLAASAGSAMVMLGHHLFDEVEVSARWRPRPDATLPNSAENMTVMTSTQPALPVVVRDSHGGWAVRDAAGTLLGRFPSIHAAQRFACAQHDGRAGPATAASTDAPPRMEERLSLRSRHIPAL
jgi:hypothetical protein